MTTAWSEHEKHPPGGGRERFGVACNPATQFGHDDLPSSAPSAQVQVGTFGAIFGGMNAFQIAIDPVWQLPLLLVGATPARSTATLGRDSVELQFGFTRVEVPYSAIADVRERDWSWLLGIGIRVASDKTLGLIGSRRGVVQITLKAPTVRGVLFMRHPRNLAISMAEPERFIEAVRARLPQSDASTTSPS